MLKLTYDLRFHFFCDSYAIWVHTYLICFICVIFDQKKNVCYIQIGQPGLDDFRARFCFKTYWALWPKLRFVIFFLVWENVTAKLSSYMQLLVVWHELIFHSICNCSCLTRSMSWETSQLIIDHTESHHIQCECHD